MQAQRHLPDANHLSILMAVLLLAYSLARYIDIPAQELPLRLPGIFLTITLNIQIVVSILVAALAASGMQWLLRDHPGRQSQSSIQHWLLPALTAMVVGAPLASLANGSQWWIVFLMGGGLLALVFVCEYLVADPADIRHPHATGVLTALSFALFLILAIAVRSAGTRLYLMLPALVPAVGLVSLRTLYLRLGGRWLYPWGAGIALVTGQLATGLHYWPVGPISFGLALLGPAYALTSFAAAFLEGRPVQTWLVEPLGMLAAIWGLALLLA